MIRIPYLREAGALIALGLIVWGGLQLYGEYQEWRDSIYQSGWDSRDADYQAHLLLDEQAKTQALAQAAHRDDLSTIATTEARDTTADQLADHNTREQRVRTLVREVPVPAVCPDPDPQLMQELAGGEGRVRSAASRLRDHRSAASGPAADPGVDG